MKSTTYLREPVKLSVSRKFVDDSERKILDKYSMNKLVIYLGRRFYRRFEVQIWQLSTALVIVISVLHVFDNR